MLVKQLQVDKYICEYDGVKYFSKPGYLITLNNNEVNHHYLTYFSDGNRTGIEQKELQFKAKKIEIVGLPAQFFLDYNKSSNELRFNASGEIINFKKIHTKGFYLPIGNSESELQNINNSIFSPHTMKQNLKLACEDSVNTGAATRAARLTHAISSYTNDNIEVTLTSVPRKETPALAISVFN